MGDIPWISSINDVEVLEYMKQLKRELSALNARMVRAMAHFHALRQDIAGGKYAADEIAAALSWSPFTASAHVDTAVRMVERLPATVAAVESGKLDMPKARAILDWTEPLPVEQARAGIATQPGNLPSKGRLTSPAQPPGCPQC